MLIRGQNGQAVFNCLTDEHTIKRIFMDIRELGKWKRILFG